jgi:transposase-like protein
VELTGEGGLLTGMVRQVLQAGLEVELADHLGYEAYDPAGRGSGNSRNGGYAKTVTTEVGPVELRMPRDRNGTFEPLTIPKHTRRLDGLSGNVISLYAKGMTTGEIQAHLEEMYDTQISRETISKITDQIVADLAAWQNRPLDRLYPVLLIDAIVIKVRDSQVANRPVYVAIGVNMEGERDVLGLWLGPAGGEGAKQWMTMLTELKNRGIADALVVCCDGLKGLPDAIRVTWPDATVQTCVVHLVRNSLRYASKTHWQAITKGLKAIYTAPTVEAATARFDDFTERWQDQYPAMVASWERSWEEFVPFLEFPVELRKVVYTTNAIESLNARFRRAVRHRGHFPNEQAALKVLYLVAQHKTPGRTNTIGRISGWKSILNALSIHYGDRIAAI